MDHSFIAHAFAVLCAALVVGALLVALADIPAHYWSRRCWWCGYAAIGLALAFVALPGWYFLFVVLK